MRSAPCASIVDGGGVGPGVAARGAAFRHSPAACVAVFLDGFFVTG